MEFKDRMKMLRKELSLTQQEFADRIGVKRNTIGAYETGQNAPSDSVIGLIIREYKVSETWLRTGEGEMFRQDKDSIIASLRDALPNLIDDAARVVEMFADLPQEDQRKTIDFLRRVSAEIFDQGEPLVTELRSELDAQKNTPAASGG